MLTKINFIVLYVPYTRQETLQIKNIFMTTLYVTS